MRRSAVLEGEHRVAGVIVVAVELALAVLQLEPSAQRRDCRPIIRFDGCISNSAAYQHLSCSELHEATEQGFTDTDSSGENGVLVDG